ncbi:MAG: TetR/AcrR family transcriptional regulator [Leptospiraceae bacterium]|nr:TetR/AcrR family transcriptional regulator [Leptospiraceae bacterium]MCP5493927.1 TetR/AcrR family transcriptional regulator [Leptospiraceae bacterium]
MDTQKIPKRKRRTRNSLTREEILHAAETIVNTEGVANLSTRRIADKLGCSVASPYAHFENYEEIVKCLIIRGEDILIGMLKSAVVTTNDSYEQISGIAKAYWQFAQEHKELHKLMFHTGPVGTIHRKALNVAPRSYRIFLITLKKGFDNGQFHIKRKNYPAFARTMWAWIYGLMVLDLTGVLQTKHSDNDPLDEGIALFSDMLRVGWKH